MEEKKFKVTKWHMIGVLVLLLLWWFFRSTPYDPEQEAEGITGQAFLMCDDGLEQRV